MSSGQFQFDHFKLADYDLADCTIIMLLFELLPVDALLSGRVVGYPYVHQGLHVT